MRSHPNILLLRTRKLNEAEKAFQRLRRDEFDQQIDCRRGTPNEMHHQHSVIAEEEHRYRCRGFDTSTAGHLSRLTP